MAGAVVAVLAAPAGAQPPPGADQAGELAVRPPPGYAARPVPPGRGQTARFEVKKPDDDDTGCQVAFTPASQNKEFSQAELDRVMRGEEWQQTARAVLGDFYVVRESIILERGARTAFAIIGDFRDRLGLPGRAHEIRTLLIIQETPRGRTSTACVAERTGFEARRPEFEEIAITATLP